MSHFSLKCAAGDDEDIKLVRGTTADKLTASFIIKQQLLSRHDFAGREKKQRKNKLNRGIYGRGCLTLETAVEDLKDELTMFLYTSK